MKNRNMSRNAASLEKSIEALAEMEAEASRVGRKCRVCGAPAQLDDGEGHYYCDGHYERDVIGRIKNNRDGWHPISPRYEQPSALDFMINEEDAGAKMFDNDPDGLS